MQCILDTNTLIYDTIEYSGHRKPLTSL